MIYPVRASIILFRRHRFQGRGAEFDALAAGVQEAGAAFVSDVVTGVSAAMAVLQVKLKCMRIIHTAISSALYEYEGVCIDFFELYENDCIIFLPSHVAARPMSPARGQSTNWSNH